MKHLKLALKILLAIVTIVLCVTNYDILIGLLLCIVAFFCLFPPLGAFLFINIGLILLVIIMRKGRKAMKYMAIPIAIVCCIIAYYHGNVVGWMSWSCSNGPQLVSYDTYRWCTYIMDCGCYTFLTWFVTWICLKFYDSIKIFKEYREERRIFEVAQKGNHQIDTQSYDCQGGE